MKYNCLRGSHYIHPTLTKLKTSDFFGNAPSWWRHQMGPFSALLALCAGNSPVPGELPTQRPVTRSFDVFFDLRLNKRLSKQPWGWWFETPPWSLWRQCNVTSGQMISFLPTRITIFQISFHSTFFIPHSKPKAKHWQRQSGQRTSRPSAIPDIPNDDPAGTLPSVNRINVCVNSDIDKKRW